MSLTMHCDHDDPPSAWCDWWTGLTQLTSDVYYGWPQKAKPGLDEKSPSFWHWCRTEAPGPGPVVKGRWVDASTTHHTLVTRNPLHLEPSLLWRCCGTHGFVRDGIWIPA